MIHRYISAIALGAMLAFSTPSFAAEVAIAAPKHAAIKTTDAKAEVQAAFDNWLAAVASHKAENVAKLYTKDAVLLPTLSPKVHNTPDMRLEYFKMFTAKPDIKGKADESHIRVFGNTAVNSGLYTFTFTKDGEEQTVPARYSFVYLKTADGWKIVDHHSSKLPAE